MLLQMMAESSLSSQKVVPYQPVERSKCLEGSERGGVEAELQRIKGGPTSFNSSLPKSRHTNVKGLQFKFKTGLHLSAFYVCYNTQPLKDRSLLFKAFNTTLNNPSSQKCVVTTRVYG
jgi:hypothetical protein